MSDIFDAFLERYETDFSTHPRPQDSYLECIIIEPRKHPRLGGVLRNMSAVLPYAALTIVCSNDNAELVMEIIGRQPNNVRVIPAFETNVSVREYNILLTSSIFWDNIAISPKILIFQTDSGIRKNNILDFIHYDYIGAPWPWVTDDYNVGNGGFSLRTRAVMSYIVNNFKFAAIDSEDLMFHSALKLLPNVRLPSPSVASAFSMEHNHHPDPLGFHKVYEFHPRDVVSKLLSSQAETERDPVPTSAYIQLRDGTTLKHPMLLPFVRLGRIPPELPFPNFITCIAPDCCMATLYVAFNDNKEYIPVSELRTMQSCNRPPDTNEQEVVPSQ